MTLFNRDLKFYEYFKTSWAHFLQSEYGTNTVMKTVGQFYDCRGKKKKYILFSKFDTLFLQA